MKNLFKIAVSLGCALHVNTAFAWGDIGHQIVGEIAEEKIKPETKDFVRGILGVEPIAVAANWPDHVRSDKRFAPDFDAFHFSELPTGKAFDISLSRRKDAYSALMGAVKILLQSPSIKIYSGEEKKIALRYLIHIVGDIHQPLHIGNGYDLGGNACLISLGTIENIGSNKTPNAINFHSFWDTDLVIGLGRTYVESTQTGSNGKFAKPPLYYPGYVEGMKHFAADKMNRDKPFLSVASNEDLTRELSQDFSKWIEESASLREIIYPDDLGGNPNAYKMGSYCQWFSDQSKYVLGSTSAKKLTPTDAKVLPFDYLNKTIKPIVETQLIVAGIRLAAVLDAIATRVRLSGQNSNSINDQEEARILHSLVRELQSE